MSGAGPLELVNKELTNVRSYLLKYLQVDVFYIKA